MLRLLIVILIFHPLLFKAQSNYNIHRDDIHGFIIKYLIEWKILPLPGSIFYVSDRYNDTMPIVRTNFEISLVNEKSSIKKACKIKEQQWRTSNVFSSVEIKSKNATYFKGEKAVDYEASANMLGYDIYWFCKLIKHNNKVYFISTTCSLEMKENARIINQNLLGLFEWI